MDNPSISYTVKPVTYGNDASILVSVSGGNPWLDCGTLYHVRNLMYMIGI